MSIDTKITVSGWVGTQPRHVVTQNGTSFTVFRLGSTKRYFDRSQETWVDGATTWYTVKSWRTTAVNVAESLRRSDPVVVHGTFATETWESPDGPRTTLVVEADALGPDLTRGQATFRHTVHLPAAGDTGPGTGREQALSGGLGGATSAQADDPWTTGDVHGGGSPGAEHGVNAAGPDHDSVATAEEVAVGPDEDGALAGPTGSGVGAGRERREPSVAGPAETDQPMSA